MAEGRLVLTAFRKALGSLESVLQIPRTDVVRDAAIQRFEYTYEIAWKMIRRHLKSLDVTEVDSMSRRELFREAARVGLIPDPELWFDYHDARNRTSHVYNESVADEVYSAATQFAPDARRLLDELEARNC